MWGGVVPEEAQKTHFSHLHHAVLPPFDEVRARLFARYLTLTAAGVKTLHSKPCVCADLHGSPHQTIGIASMVAALIGFVVATAAVSRGVF